MLYGVSAKQFFKDLGNEILDDNVFMGAAALGFYLTLAIFPALILMMTLIPYLPVPNVDQMILNALGNALPSEASGMVEKVVSEVTKEQRGGLLSFGLIATLWAASTGMYAIMLNLNITYDVAEGRSFIRARTVALGLSLMFILLVIGSFALIMLGGVIEDWVSSWLGASGILLAIFTAIRWVLIIFSLLLGFALIYYFAPNVEQKFRFITPGSVIAVVLLAAASLLFSLYISNFADYSATYGSIGAVIILMLWLFIAGLVILLGSEVNALIEHYSPYGKRKGEKSER